jgi:hypothetical protein
MVDIKRTTPGSDAERINRRLANSGAGAKPDVTVTRGSGPTRTHTNIHFCAGQNGSMNNEGGKQGGPLGNPRSGR